MAENTESACCHFLYSFLVSCIPNPKVIQFIIVYDQQKQKLTSKKFKFRECLFSNWIKQLIIINQSINWLIISALGHRNDAVTLCTPPNLNVSDFLYLSTLPLVKSKVVTVSPCVWINHNRTKQNINLFVMKLRLVDWQKNNQVGPNLSKVAGSTFSNVRIWSL